MNGFLKIMISIIVLVLGGFGILMLFGVIDMEQSADMGLKLLGAIAILALVGIVIGLMAKGKSSTE